jgi:hypothetical protein
LMENRRQNKNHPVVAVNLIHEAPPIILTIAAYSFPSCGCWFVAWASSEVKPVKINEE